MRPFFQPVLAVACDGLKAIRSALHDQRVNNRIYVEPEISDGRTGTIYLPTLVEAAPDCLLLRKIMNVHRDPRRRDETERKVIGRHD